MILTEELIQTGQKALEETFEGYQVRHTQAVGEYFFGKRDWLKCSDGKVRKFIRRVVEERKRVYWKFV